MSTLVFPASHRTPKYSFAWAATIVRQARQSHARGWDILDRFIGLSDRQLAYLIACNAPEWPFIRRLVHVIDNWDHRQARFGPTPLVWDKNMLLNALSATDISAEKLVSYLTAQINRLE